MIDRVETQKIIDECGKYAAVVIGAVNNPQLVRGSLLLVEGDISRLREQMDVAEAAKRRLIESASANPPVVGSPITSLTKRKESRGDHPSTQEPTSEIP